MYISFHKILASPCSLNLNKVGNPEDLLNHNKAHINSRIIFSIFQAQHKESGIFAALKEVEIKTEEDLEDFSVEIDILIACQHKNVVGLHEAFYFNGVLSVSQIP